MTRKVSNTMVDALMLVGGSVVGAGLALMFAPQSGAKCRRDIARFGKTVGRKSDRLMRNINDSVSGFAETFNGKTSAILHKW
jgi:gas vesicle protein